MMQVREDLSAVEKVGASPTIKTREAEGSNPNLMRQIKHAAKAVMAVSVAAEADDFK